MDSQSNSVGSLKVKPILVNTSESRQLINFLDCILLFTIQDMFCEKCDFVFFIFDNSINCL